MSNSQIQISKTPYSTMPLDTRLVITVSLVGITIITALVVVINLFVGMQDKEKNHHKIK